MTITFNLGFAQLGFPQLGFQQLGFQQLGFAQLGFALLPQLKTVIHYKLYTVILLLLSIHKGSCPNYNH